MEVTSIALILDLGGLNIVLQSSKVTLGELFLVFSGEAVLFRGRGSFVVLAVDRGAGGLSERLAVKVLGFNLGNVASVSGDVLGLDVGGGTAEPVIAELRVVSVLHSVVHFVLVRRVGVEVSLGEHGLSNGDVDVVVGGLVSLLGDDLVDIASSAAIYVVLFGHVTSVTWQVLFPVLDVRHIQIRLI